MDNKVHFLNIVRLTRRLIKLDKVKRKLVVYPVKPHGFCEPNSWTDEYKWIFKLFEENLRK